MLQKLSYALALRQPFDTPANNQDKALARLLALLIAVMLMATGCSGLWTPTPLVSLNPSPSHRDELGEPSGQRIRFERISLEQGLSQSSVFCIWQDSKGLMWFGTQDGLNKYDGYDFTVYKPIPDDPNSLAHNSVWSIYEDQSGVLWIGTDGEGLDRFDRETGQFVHYRYSSGDRYSLSNNFVHSIHEDREGILWIGTAGGLNKFDRKRDRFIRYQHDDGDPYSLSHNLVRAIYEDREGVLWIGTEGGGLDRFDRENERFIHYWADPGDRYSLSNNTALSVYEDREGILWIGTEAGGLNRLDRSTGHFTRYLNDPDDPHSLSSNSVRAIYEDRWGVLWIGTNGGGLNQFDREREQFIHYQTDLNDPSSLSNNWVWSIYEDQSGVLWIGTVGGGINKVDRSTGHFAHYQIYPDDPTSLSHNLVWAIYEDPSGILWIGTHGGGLVRFDRDSGQFTHYENDPKDPYSLSNNVVRAIGQDQAGVLWVGTEGGGINKLVPSPGSGQALSDAEGFDKENDRFIHYRNDPSDPHSLSSDEVLSLYVDREGTLWIGTLNGGLNRFDRSTERFVRYQYDGLTNNMVRSILEDRSGVLWLGTGTGLYKLDREREQLVRYQANPRDPHSLSDNIILSVYEDRQDVLWIGTFGGGLNRLVPSPGSGQALSDAEGFDKESETFTHYREKDGLPNDVVYGILEDDQGFLWISTNNGLSKFDPRTETFRNYDVTDGLQSNEFDAGAYFRSRSGEMFFGGVNGFNAFYPDGVKENLYVPPIVLTSLKQGGEDVDVDTPIESVKAVTFHWPNNFFEFEFAALNYTRAEKNQYAYMLEGFEKDWNYTGTGRFGRYTNLPGRTYTLRIKGSNNDGVWNEEGISLKVTIVPPFWETLWFRGIVALALVGSVIGSYRLRVRSIKARSRELGEQVEQRTAELRQEMEQREQIEEALRKSETQQAVAAERNRLARELHDAVTQTLFSASLIAETLPTIWEGDQDEGRELLEELRQLSRGALAEMRTLLLELRPAALAEASLGDLLRQLGEAVTGRTGVPVMVTIEGQVALSSDVHVALYRIAQEALNNVVKHAQASQVAVSLRCTPAPYSLPSLTGEDKGSLSSLTEEDGDSLSPLTGEDGYSLPPLKGGGWGGVELQISDNGRGFDPSRVPPDRLGLGIIRERVQAIGARLKIESQPGHGTQVVALWKKQN